jgi:hypothetical protein
MPDKKSNLERLRQHHERVLLAAKTPGAKASDNWIYAGISPDTQKAMYIAPAHIGQMGWTAATKAAAQMEEKLKKNVRLPSAGELAVIFNNKAHIPRFDKPAGPGMGDGYWSSTESHGGQATVVKFSDGTKFNTNKSYLSASVRFVRD